MQTTIPARPLAPSWLQAFVPALRDTLASTADRKYQADATITFDAGDLSVAQWGETRTLRCEVNLANRTRSFKGQKRRSPYNPDDALETAVAAVQEKGEWILQILRRNSRASAFITLVIKDGEAKGIKYGFSEPIQSQSPDR